MAVSSGYQSQSPEAIGVSIWNSTGRTIAGGQRIAPCLGNSVNASSTGARWSRTDVIRACLTRGADERGAKGEAP